jgi:hypothetical protein
LNSGSNFAITSTRCSENNLFKDQVKSGEEVEIEIYTKDFEMGKQEFSAWLKTNGLAESPTLRITYTHNPK